ncbi:hypothetical protein ACFPYJ_15245 [Paenibacillus solisilvae]|uniref:Uncharacterized protein n=1 Tax=Paenibacillus solisilvae TaxID=2486751 RepID=A0ABW0VX35_9BACL
MRKWFPLYAALIILMASSQVSAAAQTTINQPGQEQSRLEQQVQAWTNILAAEPQFKSWKIASTTIAPIGPGMHGWLVTFQLNRKPVGYMIVNATQDGGFALSEYGVGDHPAYDPNTLYKSMIRQGYYTSYADAIKKPLQIERLYVHPLLAVWKWIAPDGQAVYMDAWSGESLPIDDQIWSKQAKLSAISTQAEPINAPALSQLSSSRTNVTFDPYERMPWLTKSPLSMEQVSKLPDLLNHKTEIRFTAELYDASVLFVYPTIGYHVWNGKFVYAAFDQEGTRYVSLSSIQSKGRFYK